MRKKIVVSSYAKKDIAKLKTYIRQELKMEGTAASYIEDLNITINKLSYCAGAVGKNDYVQKMFGDKARHITYKKMVIIFSIKNETVYIKRIIAGSLIH
jgi:hypothetical protein